MDAGVFVVSRGSVGKSVPLHAVDFRAKVDAVV